MLNKINISIPKEKLTQFCQVNKIRKLAFFGSVLRDDFSPESDLDILVEFLPNNTLGLKFFLLEEELTKLLGYNVDLQTPNFLHSRIREQVLKEAIIYYEKS